MDSFSSYTFQKAYQKIHRPGRQTRRNRETPRLGGLHTHHSPYLPQQDPARRQTQRRPGGDGETAGPPGLVRPQRPELERQVNDRISFRSFLGFPDVIPDATTVWLFRERLAKLRSVGKSVEGRELWLMEITNLDTGAPETKPAVWIDGNTHAGRLNNS